MSEAKGEAVLILSHIPLGGMTGVSQIYIDIVAAILERYKDTIKGVFSGHTHSDQVIFHNELRNGDQVVTTEFIAPSLTTYTAINPSFRVLEFDRETNELLGYEQYRMDLRESNLKGKAVWKMAYSFLAEYDLPDMS